MLSVNLSNFRCVQCLGPFPNGDFIEHGGFLYCPSHFHRQFGDRCAACFEIIDGGFVNAIDKKWHKNHFNCYQCDVPLQTTFVAMHGHPFCKTCHLQIKNRIQGKPCSKCDKLIFPNDLVMRHNGKDSHLHHFECVRCLEPLKADYKLWDKQFYCQKDYAKLNFINCDVCSKPIEGRNIEAIGKHFHPEVRYTNASISFAANVRFHSKHINFMISKGSCTAKHISMKSRDHRVEDVEKLQVDNRSESRTIIGVAIIFSVLDVIVLLT